LVHAIVEHFTDGLSLAEFVAAGSYGAWLPLEALLKNLIRIPRASVCSEALNDTGCRLLCVGQLFPEQLARDEVRETFIPLSAEGLAVDDDRTGFLVDVDARVHSPAVLLRSADTLIRLARAQCAKRISRTHLPDTLQNTPFGAQYIALDAHFTPVRAVGIDLLADAVPEIGGLAATAVEQLSALRESTVVGVCFTG